MKGLLALLSFLIGSVSLFSQITFDQFPKPLQLFPRNMASNMAQVHISGHAAGSADSLIFTMEKSDGVIQSQNLALNQLPGGNFDVVFDIQAGLWTYTFKVERTDNGMPILLQEAGNIVAGDAFVVEGQSNAQAVAYNGDANIWQNNFVRCFGSPNPDNYTDQNWYLAEGNGYFSPGAVGQWALRMGYLIQENLQIPVAIINGADPGKPIEFFQRNDALPEDPTTNYGRLLQRLNNAGLSQQVRAMMFYQGEADGNRADIHKTLFEALHADWEENYPSIEAYYVVQVREGCGAPSLQLREYQKDFENYLNHVKALTANGINGHDGCHYALIGYKTLGEKMFKQVSADLYNTPTGEQTNIRVLSAHFTNELNTQISLVTDAVGGPLTLQPGAAFDFKLQGASASVIGIQAMGDTLILDLDQSVNNPITGLSYGGHSGSDAWVLNAFGYGMFTFYNLPIEDYHVVPNFDIPGIMSGSGNCLNLDGVDDYVYVGAVLDSSYTKEAWINWRGGGSAMNIISGAQNTAFWLPNGYLSSGHNGAWSQVSDHELMPANQWTHVAVSYDASLGEMRLYKNGKLISQALNIASHHDPVVLIGAFSGCCTFPGKIDEVRIWNTVRSVEEIRANMCQKLKGDETGLSAYFRFDETAGSTAPNVTGGPDGQLTNFQGVGLNEAWQRSGAPIGTKSSYTYQNVPQLGLSIASGDSLVLTTTNISDFVHLYFTEEVPNVLEPAAGFSIVDNAQYFGLFYPAQSISDYELKYYYSGNPFAFVQEPKLGLLKRRNNAQTYWEKTPQFAVDQDNKVVEATGTQYQEYILAINDSVPANPLMAILGVLQSIRCNGVNDGVITVTTMGGQAPFSYSLNGGPAQFSGFFNNLPPGNYTALVTDNLGQTVTTGEVSLQSPAPLTASILVNDNNVTLEINGGVSPYSFSSDAPNPNLQDLPNGAYSVTITDGNACRLIASFSIQYFPLSLANTQSDPDSCDGVGELTILAQGGTAPYLYSLNGGPFQASNTFQDLPAGLFSVQVKDGANQLAEQTNIELQVPPILEALSAVASDTLLVTVHGGSAPYTFSLNGGASQTTGLFVNLTAGMYTVEVTDVLGCTTQVTAVIASTGTNAPNVHWGISLLPNPSTGIYQIKAQGLEELLHAVVFDLTGKKIRSFEIAPVANTVILDLSDQADGIYMLRATNGVSNQYWRLIKIRG